MSKMKEKVLQEFDYIKKYFLDIQLHNQKIDSQELLRKFTKITTSIIFEQDEKNKKVKINFLLFWLNYIIDEKSEELTEEIKISIINIINSLDLYQINSHIKLDNFQNLNLEFNLTMRNLFNNDMLLTNAQLDIFMDILENKNIIFSAPTSYGKSSIVINALFIKLKEKDLQNIIFVLPTKALINEYRKNLNRLMENFKYKVEINESPYLDLKKNVQYVHLFTQERVVIFDQINYSKIDYVVFDEIQDLLNIGAKNSSARAVLLAKAISIFENKNVPMIFLMPYIQNPESEFLNLFTSVQYSVKKNLLSPTTSNKYLIVKENNQYSLLDVSFNKGFAQNYYRHALNIDNIYHGNNFYDIKYDFYKICEYLNVLDEKNICFCNKSDISSITHIFNKDKKEVVLSNRLKAVINYLEDYVHPNFELITFLRRGVGIHHADLDAFTKRQIEECFRDKECTLNTVFCTSTLLQGVNLNANNLFFLAKQGEFNNIELDKKIYLVELGELEVNYKVIYINFG